MTDARKFTPCGSEAQHSIRQHDKSNSEPTVGEAISVGSLRPILTAAKTLGGPDPRTPIMRRLHADRGDNPDSGASGTKGWKSTPGTFILFGPQDDVQADQSAQTRHTEVEL
jgi:hypothetical protein